MSIEALQQAVNKIGGQSALAAALSGTRRKLTQAHVWNWLNSPNPAKAPPAEYCPDIERITGIRCEELRPDVDWAVLRGKCQDNASDGLPPERQAA